MGRRIVILCRKCMTFPAGCPQHGRALRRQQADRDRKQALQRLEAQNRPADTPDAAKSDVWPDENTTISDLRELNRRWLEQQQRKAWLNSAGEVVYKVNEMFKTVITKYAREVYL